MKINFLKKPLLLVLGVLFLISGLHAYQPARLVMNGAFINITQGAQLVIDNPSPDAITRNSGNIISEGEKNIVRWNIGTSTGNYEIPWGDNTNYFPLLFTPTDAVGNGYFNFSTYPTPWNNSSALPTGITEINNASGADNSAFVIDRFWRMEAVGYTTKPTLSNLVFTYLDAEHSAPGNTITESNLRAQRYNDIVMTWADYPPSGTVNTITNTVTVASVSPTDLFKWWTLVDQSSPLPVSLVSFTALPDNRHVRLKWTTETEVNNDYFTVERSPDGTVFEFVVKIEGAGTSSTALEYTTLDYHPLAGISYYRLKQTDFDGHTSYSNIVAVKMGQASNFSFKTHPNPVTGGNLNLEFKNLSIGNTEIKILSVIGRELFVQLIPITSQGDFNTVLSLPGELPPGIYLIKINSNNSTQTKKFILR